MKIEYTGLVDSSGVLKITNRRKFDHDIQSYFSGKAVEITIQKKRKKRSLMQNAYYWKVVIPIMQQGFIDMGTECSKEDVHEFLKAKFNYTEVVNKDTAVIERFPQSTTIMSTSQFMDYIASIQRFAIEFLNCRVPDPNEDLTLEL